MVEEFIEVLKECKSVEQKIELLFQSIETLVSITTKSFNVMERKYTELERKILKIEYGMLRKQQEQPKITEIPNIEVPKTEVKSYVKTNNIHEQLMSELKEIMKKKKKVIE